MSAKLAPLALALALAPSFAFATQTKQFASCYGDHHGSYLDMIAVLSSATNEVVQVNIGVSNDSGQPPVFYTIKELTKNGEKLQPKAYSWAIRQAIKAEAKGEFYGFLKITATNAKGSVMHVNLQKFTGTLRHALSIDGYIEELTCPVERVQD